MYMAMIVNKELKIHLPFLPLFIPLFLPPSLPSSLPPSLSPSLPPSLPPSPAFSVPALPVLSSAPLLPPPHLVRYTAADQLLLPITSVVSLVREGGREGRRETGKEGPKLGRDGGGWVEHAPSRQLASV